MDVVKGLQEFFAEHGMVVENLELRQEHTLEEINDGCLEYVKDGYVRFIMSGRIVR